MSMTTIAEYASHVEADLARLKLFGEGIDAHIMDGGMASLGLGFMTPARLMVLREDEAQARAILTVYAEEQLRQQRSVSGDQNGNMFDDADPDEGRS